MKKVLFVFIGVCGFSQANALNGQIETKGDVTTSSAETQHLVAGQAERPSVAQTETVIETHQ